MQRNDTIELIGDSRRRGAEFDSVKGDSGGDLGNRRCVGKGVDHDMSGMDARFPANQQYDRDMSDM